MLSLRCSQLLFCYKPSPLIDAQSVQHVFKWGVGNEFRSLNKNRFKPVHHARPKEVTISKDYFDSPNEMIKYDQLNEAWEVFWTENMKVNAKPFPIKKFGVKQAKLEAEKWALIVKQRDAPTTHNHSDLGVFWDDRMQCWFSLRSRKAFSAAKHGHAKAKQLAEKAEGIDPIQVAMDLVLAAIKKRKSDTN